MEMCLPFSETGISAVRAADSFRKKENLKAQWSFLCTGICIHHQDCLFANDKKTKQNKKQPHLELV